MPSVMTAQWYLRVGCRIERMQEGTSCSVIGSGACRASALSVFSSTAPLSCPLQRSVAWGVWEPGAWGVWAVFVSWDRNGGPTEYWILGGGVEGRWSWAKRGMRMRQFRPFAPWSSFRSF